jgi:hypothetical protein
VLPCCDGCGVVVGHSSRLTIGASGCICDECAANLRDAPLPEPKRNQALNFDERKKMRARRCLFALFILAGCGSPVSDPSTPSNPDSSAQPAPDARASDKPICCVLTDNLTDSAFYHDAVYDCDLDSTAYDNIPWICIVGEDEMTCMNRKCVVGSSCRGFNGWGKVVVCPE